MDAQHTPWLYRSKPLLKWSRNFRCWICAGRGIDAQGITAAGAFNAWRTALSQIEGATA